MDLDRATLRFCFDLDGTLCRGGETGAYANARPLKHRIARVRELHEQGHYIIIDTARGTGTGEDWWELTREQLQRWGVPHHELRVGKKMVADIYIDDRAVWDRDFFGDR